MTPKAATASRIALVNFDADPHSHSGADVTDSGAVDVGSQETIGNGNLLDKPA